MLPEASVDQLIPPKERFPIPHWIYTVAGGGNLHVLNVNIPRRPRSQKGAIWWYGAECRVGGVSLKYRGGGSKYNSLVLYSNNSMPVDGNICTRTHSKYFTNRTLTYTMTPSVDVLRRNA